MSRPFPPRFAAITLAFCATLAVLTLMTAQPVVAQTLERRDTVAERGRPEFDPVGIRVGGMTLLPSVGVELRYDDNIFADDEVKQDDTAIIMVPALVLNSRSARHRAQFGADADLARYSDYDSEDYDDARLWALGAMALGRGEIEGEARLSKLHEARTSPDDIRGTGLTEFQQNRFGIAYTYSPGRLLARADLVYQTLDFDPTPTAGGSVNNDDRDRSLADLGLRLGYAVSPDYAVYVEARADEIDYDQRADRDGFRRSSEGAEARLGTLLDFTGTTKGEFYVGYLSRDYDDARYSNGEGMTFGGRVDWNITGLTTITAAASRTIDSTTVVGASGITKTELALGVDHELLRNLILSLGLALGTDDFDGLDRSDDLSRFEFGGRYLMNRNLELRFGYLFQDRDTSPESSGGRIYEINELFLRVVGQI